MKKLSILYLLLCLVIVGCETTQDDFPAYNTILSDPVGVYGGFAESGNAEAAYRLAKCYEAGRGTDTDLEKATHWYEIAAEKGHIKATVALGNIYEDSEYLEKAFKWYEKAALSGHAGAQCEIGYAYHDGRGVRQDLEQAIYWYEKSAKEDYTVSIYNLGILYRDLENYELSVKYLTRATDLGSTLAWSELGDAYRLGRGVEKDLDKAIYWLDKASKDERSNLSLYNLAKACYENGEREKALSCLKLSIKQGDVDSMNLAGNFCKKNANYKEAIRYYQMGIKYEDKYAYYNLARLYHGGLGIDQDVYRALELYLKAVSLGHNDSLYYIGRIYKDRAEYEKALEFFEKSSNLGDTDSYFYMGYLYSEGLGVEKDIEAAIEWYEKGAAQGDKASMYNLGQIYKGMKDYELALKCFKEASDLGDIDSYFYMGYFYYGGLGIEKDIETGIEWYKKSAEHNCVNSFYNLGVIYNELQQYQLTIKWYEKGVKAGHSASMNNLGELYREKGEYKKAVELYHQAAELKNGMAMFNLAEFYRDGLGVAIDLEQAVEWFKKSADAGFDLAKKELKKEAYAEYLK